MRRVLAWFGRLSLLVQSIRLGLSQIWANKTRSALTTLGIVIGVASVTSVIAAVTGLRERVLQDFETLGAKAIYIGPRQPYYEGGGKFVPWDKIMFRTEEFERLLENCPSVAIMGRISQMNATVSRGQRAEDAMLWAIDPAWHETEQRFVKVGRPFSLMDAEAHRNVCLVSEEVQEKLDLDRDPTGQSVIIWGREFTVVGVVDPPEKMMMGMGMNFPSEVMVPFTTGLRMQTRSGFFVKALAKSADVAQEAEEEIKFYMRRVRQLKPDDPDTFSVQSVQQFVEAFQAIGLVMSIVAGCIVGISLLVGGVGIMNIMLVSVSERTREIGLRKAVGARPTTVLFQFLVEAVTLCVFGGVMGVVAGELMTFGIAHIPKSQMQHASVPLWAIIVSLCFCTAVGLCFGMWPAIKAARMDPIEALRHE
jgi:putative ABC transport system permease protein